MRNPSEVTRSRHGALQLVSTKAMSREDWLEVRKRGIGASDAAAAVGISPYQSPLELWMIKTGRDGDMPKPDPNDESSPMYWGNILEPIVAQHYTRRTGYKVRKVNAVLQHADPDKHWMLANLDYSVVNHPEVQILECKTAGEWGAKLWRDGVPAYVQCQVQHQLAVTGRQAADVCVLLCGQEIRIHRIERDDDLIARLIELERQFWHYVETDTPPPADGSDSSGKALKYLYPQDTGDVLDLSEDPHLCQVFTELLAAREDIARAQKIEDERKQAIQQRMGEASKVIFPTGAVTWKQNKSGSRRFLVHI
jgi:putative phage-type endonuclease